MPSVDARRPRSTTELPQLANCLAGLIPAPGVVQTRALDPAARIPSAGEPVVRRAQVARLQPAVAPTHGPTRMTSPTINRSGATPTVALARSDELSAPSTHGTSRQRPRRMTMTSTLTRTLPRRSRANARGPESHPGARRRRVRRPIQLIRGAMWTSSPLRRTRRAPPIG